MDQSQRDIIASHHEYKRRKYKTEIYNLITLFVPNGLKTKKKISGHTVHLHSKFSL